MCKMAMERNRRNFGSRPIGILSGVLLFVIGIYCTITGLAGLLTGLFVGMHIVLPAVLHLAGASIAFILMYKIQSDAASNRNSKERGQVS